METPLIRNFFPENYKDVLRRRHGENAEVGHCDWCFQAHKAKADILDCPVCHLIQNRSVSPTKTPKVPIEEPVKETGEYVLYTSLLKGASDNFADKLSEMNKSHKDTQAKMTKYINVLEADLKKSRETSARLNNSLLESREELRKCNEKISLTPSAPEITESIELQLAYAEIEKLKDELQEAGEDYKEAKIASHEEVCTALTQTLEATELHNGELRNKIKILEDEKVTVESDLKKIMDKMIVGHQEEIGRQSQQQADEKKTYENKINQLKQLLLDAKYKQVLARCSIRLQSREICDLQILNDALHLKIAHALMKNKELENKHFQEMKLCQTELAQVSEQLDATVQGAETKIARFQEELDEKNRLLCDAVQHEVEHNEVMDRLETSLQKMKPMWEVGLRCKEATYNQPCPNCGKNHCIPCLYNTEKECFDLTDPNRASGTRCMACFTPVQRLDFK